MVRIYNSGKGFTYYSMCESVHDTRTCQAVENVDHTKSIMLTELSCRRTGRNFYEIPKCMHLKVSETVFQGSNKGICYGHDDRS